MSEEGCLDLTTMKGFWVIVHYHDCDPGNEFEILHENQLASDSWETLVRGAQVTVKFGNAKVQAYVVFVSDDYHYLSKNFKSITEQYEAEIKMKGDSDKPKVRTRKNYVKVADTSTQTGDSLPYNELQEENRQLKGECEKLKKVIDNLKLTLKCGLANLETASDIKNVVPCKKENNARVLLPKLPTNNVEVGTDSKEKEECAIYEEDDNMVYIGTNKTAIPKESFSSINWLSYSAATRKLLVSAFSRKILATHSLTGRPSPAFIGIDKGIKMRLDPIIVNDIVDVVSKKCRVSESIVRGAITTKCADENKMYRKRMSHKENENQEPQKPIKKQKLNL